MTLSPFLECYGRSGKANGLTQIFLLTSAPLQLLLAGTRALKSVFINALNESLKDVMVLLDEPETVDNLITQVTHIDLDLIFHPLSICLFILLNL